MQVTTHLKDTALGQPGSPNVVPREEVPSPTPAERGGFAGPVVGIGASAGGLDALERLFSALPSDSGAAFVVVQHLSPHHKSMMDSLLSRYTAMTVKVVEHGCMLSADTVFLIPPGHLLRLSGARLLLSPKPEQGLSLSIDVFFESLAEQCGSQAIAVVLSGTGSDGSRGAVSINAAGGFVYVQEAADARFDGMPRSAIATGLADAVASAEVLAEKVAERIRTPRPPPVRLAETAAETSLSYPLDGIMELLLASGGIDFRDYKATTVLRRIERRMQVLHMATLAAYRDLLAATPREQLVLRRELLIPVTRFFRDPEVFDVLAEQVVGKLAQDATADSPVRVWVAACATGEEAYSVAMLFAEAFERLGRPRSVKIFATDVEPLYLEHASAALYAQSIAAEVSAKRLERFFVHRDNGWSVCPDLRQMIIFTRHNVITDAPFTRMDLVICRNALIYLQPAPQEQALRRLQYALKAGGYFVQGPSEALGAMHRDFTVVSPRHRIYQLTTRPRLPLVPINGKAGGPSHLPRSSRTPAAPQVAGAQQWVAMGHRQLQNSYHPPTLLISPSRELLHVYGDPRGLLRFGEGQVTLDVLKLLPSDLAWPVSQLLHALALDATSVASMMATTGEGETRRRLRVVVRSLQGNAEEHATVLPGTALVSFEPADDAAGTATQADPTADADPSRHIEALERELERSYQNLQSTIEELEASNEELQATNEELMSSNEELQSTNEELQSVNEELYTVNAEYQEKVDVLHDVNADLENVSKAASIPILFVDEQLNLTRFTPELAQLFKVRDSDIGRSLEDLVHVLNYPELYDDLRQRIAGSALPDREVTSRDGRWWLARIQPYLPRGPGNTRAVMTFIDVSSVRASQRLQSVLDSLDEHVAVLDVHGTITLVNKSWRDFAAANGDPELRTTGPGVNYLRVCAAAAAHDDSARDVHDRLQEVLAGRAPGFRLLYPCRTREGLRTFQLKVCALRNAGGGATVTHLDCTSWVDGQNGAAAATADASPPP